MSAGNVSPAGVYFNDGCVRATDYIYIAGKINGVDPDAYTFSRTYACNLRGLADGAQPRWGRTDHPKQNVISVCHWTNTPYTEAPGWGGARLVAMSRRGEVCLSAAGVPDVRERIQGVIASVCQIRQIGDRLYACGMQGQVFRREDDGWARIDRGIADPRISGSALHLNTIDGTSDRDIYIAGFGGRILHNNGTGWVELTSPTNVHLERVHCVSPSEVYFCGNKGTFLRLSNGSFTDHSIRTEEHFWGLASFQGKVYLATLERLYVFDGKQVRPIDTKLRPPIGGYRLDASKEQLWSFGVEDLAWFDGKAWGRLKHPDNP